MPPVEPSLGSVVDRRAIGDRGINFLKLPKLN